jgi:hypothetical protein
MTFWCGSGSGDPCLCSDPDPAIFVIDLQDASKQSIVLLPRACSRFEKGKVSPNQYEDQAKRGECQFKRGECQFKRGECQFKRGQCQFKRGQCQFKRGQCQFKRGQCQFKRGQCQFKRGQCQFKRGQCQFKRGQCQFKRGECKIKRKRALQRHAKGQKQASASLQTSQLSTTSFPNKIRGAR